MSINMRRRLAKLEASNDQGERLIIVSGPEDQCPGEILRSFGVEARSKDLTIAIRKPRAAHPWVRVNGRDAIAGA